MSIYMLKYTYKLENYYDYILNAKIHKAKDLAKSFFIIYNAIHVVYDFFQNPADIRSYSKKHTPRLIW